MLPTKGRLCERPLETRAKTFHKSFTKRWRPHSGVSGRHNLAGCVFFAYLRWRKKSEACSRGPCGLPLGFKLLCGAKPPYSELLIAARRGAAYMRLFELRVFWSNFFSKKFVWRCPEGRHKLPSGRGVGQTAPQTSRLPLHQG